MTYFTGFGGRMRAGLGWTGMFPSSNESAVSEPLTIRLDTTSPARIEDKYFVNQLQPQSLWSVVVMARANVSCNNASIPLSSE